MYEYDADGSQIEFLQQKLAENGITREQFDLRNYAGCTYRELKNLTNAVIANKTAKEGYSE